MKFAFLPHYFKKIGLACFFGSLIFVVVTSIIVTLQALKSIPPDEMVNSFRMGMELGEEFVSSNYWVIQIGGILILLSMAFYMLAKEKVDDEYMDVMRWESLRLSVLVSIAVTILCILFHVMLTAKSILFIQFITYLIAFKVKKSNDLPN